MILNKDYSDMLCALSGEKVRFLLVGAYAMAVHGYPRATADMDIWLMPSSGNSEAVIRALREFGAPLAGLTSESFQKEGVVLQIGVAPRRIDLLTSATGLRFEEAEANSIELDMAGAAIRVLSLKDLIKNKIATGRSKDFADAEALEALITRSLE